MTRMCEDLITQSTIRKLYRMVKPYVLMNCGSMQDVEDVLQDGLYKFLNVYSKNGFDQENKLENYIFSICKNYWLKEVKKKNKLKLNGNVLVEDIEDNEWELKNKQRKKLLLEIFERSLELLGDKSQKLLQLKKDGLSDKEIAEILNLKNSQIVKDKFYRSKQRLRELIKQDKEYKNILNHDYG